jgi:excisionase family DNA binding protein
MTTRELNRHLADRSSNVWTEAMGDDNQVEQQLSVAEVAERLSVDQSTVWRWVKKGKIAPVRKLGRRIVRIPVSAVNKFLEAQTV